MTEKLLRELRREIATDVRRLREHPLFCNAIKGEYASGNGGIESDRAILTE